MGYASIAGRARTSSRSPSAHAICDRCGFRYNYIDLKWQFDWRGASLQNLRILVCKRCYDKPQEQLRAIVLPPDPQSIINARPEIFPNDETTFLTLTTPEPPVLTADDGSTILMSDDGTILTADLAPATIDPTTGIPIPSTTVMALVDGVTAMTTVPVGAPLGYTGLAQMPIVKDVIWDIPVPYLSIIGFGTATVSVTCSAPHGLSTNAQIYVSGLSQSAACGIYSIVVTTATAFTYQVNSNVKPGYLTTGNEKMFTTNMGLPYGYLQVPLIGGQGGVPYLTADDGSTVLTSDDGTILTAGP